MSEINDKVAELEDAKALLLTKGQARDILGQSPCHHRYNPECYCVRCEDITAKLLRLAHDR